MNGRFFNRMEFPINMRQTWLPGSPAIHLKSGQIIEGPYDLLIQFKFLAPIPFDFHRVDSVTQSQDGEFKDVQKTDPIIITAPLELHAIKEDFQPVPGAVHHPAPQKEIEVQPASIDVSQLPFDPKNVNWLSVKVDDLKKAAALLNIDITTLQGKKPKELKWELVKLVKKAFGLGN